MLILGFRNVEIFVVILEHIHKLKIIRLNQTGYRILLSEILAVADFVKFAKHTASEQENAAVLPLAVRFVTQTYQDDLAAQAEENKKEGE